MVTLFLTGTLLKEAWGLQRWKIISSTLKTAFTIDEMTKRQINDLQTLKTEKVGYFAP